MPVLRSLIPLFAAVTLQAFSPRFHETQTALAVGLIPRDMAHLLRTHSSDLLAGARGAGSDEVPTVEEVEDQFRRILRLSEERRRPGQVVKELGVLARMVQLLADPSATAGVTPLRERFEVYGQEHLPRLVVTRDTFWAVSAPLDPRPKLLEIYREKYERHQVLAAHFDADTGKQVGPWDTLSIPYAQLQLSFSGGVNATANFWIQAWRAVGDLWELPPTPKP